VLVVNALAVPPDIDMSRLRPDTILMDMTYRPLVTAFLAQGRDRGLTTVDGLAMLIGQARPSFRALFGVDPPPVDVRSLALRELGETP
jgi:shikimate dehydrogenase